MGCEMCYSYIYDTIANPFHYQHRLYGSICLTPEITHRITETFEQVLEKFGTNPYFFYRYEDDDLPDVVDEESFDKWAWLKFKNDYPELFMDLMDEIHENLQGLVGKKKRDIEIQVTRFFMNKLRVLLLSLSDVHDLHTKKEYTKESSTGPVPYMQLVEIRTKANLPVPHYDVKKYEKKILNDSDLYS